MKNYVFLTAVATVLVLCLSGCKKQQTPYTDTTKLWPAYDMNAKKYGYIDKSGTFKISAIYSSASNFFSCGYAQVSMEESECYIDTKGGIKYSSTTATLRPFFYNYALIYDNNKYGMLDKNFNLSIPCMYYKLLRMSYDGLVASELNDESLCGYVDAKGQTKISATFYSIKTFDNGYAVASVDGEKYGLIDKSGKFVVQPSYDEIYSLGKARWAAYSNSSEGYFMIDAKGNTKGFYKDLLGSEDDDNLFCFENSNGKCGVVDKEGKEIISATYDYIGSFSQGYAAAYIDDMFYIIDKKGSVVYSEAKAEAYTSMHNDLILVVSYASDDYVYKWMDKKGSTIYTWTFKSSKKAPARKSLKTEEKEWTPEQYFVLGE